MNEKPICPFGEILVRARTERNITQYRLAKMVGRNPRYISQLEHNKREPKLSTIILLARALGMDAGELVSAVEKIMPEIPLPVADGGGEARQVGRPKKKTDK